MEFIAKIFKCIFHCNQTVQSKSKTQAQSTGTSIMPKTKRTQSINEIIMVKDLSDEEIRQRQQRQKYVQLIKNPDHKIKKGENIDSIARKYNVSVNEIFEVNGISKNTVLRIGQTLKIPPTKKLKNIKTLDDTANAVGVSKDFIKKLKRIEDSQGLPDNKFHNTPYNDGNGVLTIGIGHALKKGEKQKLTNAEVCELLAKDLLKCEDTIVGILGRRNYEKFYCISQNI